MSQSSQSTPICEAVLDDGFAEWPCKKCGANIPDYCRDLGRGRTSRSRLSAVARLFQARMWREYAQAWDGKPTMTGVGREWVEKILGIPRSECLRRARVNVYLARRMNRRPL